VTATRSCQSAFGTGLVNECPSTSWECVWVLVVKGSGLSADGTRRQPVTGCSSLMQCWLCSRSLGGPGADCSRSSKTSPSPRWWCWMLSSDHLRRTPKPARSPRTRAPPRRLVGSDREMPPAQGSRSRTAGQHRSDRTCASVTSRPSAGRLRFDGLDDDGARQHVTGAHGVEEAHAVDLLASDHVVPQVHASRCEPLEDRGRVQAACDQSAEVAVRGEIAVDVEVLWVPG